MRDYEGDDVRMCSERIIVLLGVAPEPGIQCRDCAATATATAASVTKVNVRTPIIIMRNVCHKFPPLPNESWQILSEMRADC